MTRPTNWNSKVFRDPKSRREVSESQRAHRQRLRDEIAAMNTLGTGVELTEQERAEVRSKVVTAGRNWNGD